VERLVFINKSKHAIDEFVSLEIGEFAQLSGASEMRGVEGVTAGTAQGALLGDFDRKRGRATTEDTCPRVKDFGCFHDLSPNKVGLVGCQLRTGADPRERFSFQAQERRRSNLTRLAICGSARTDRVGYP
jgi:hypothetical protein